jgi:hypothetical protein
VTVNLRTWWDSIVFQISYQVFRYGLDDSYEITPADDDDAGPDENYEATDPDDVDAPVVDPKPA